jgi:hypothetical protein
MPGLDRLWSVLAAYVDYCNGHRPHRALGQAPPLEPSEPVVLARRLGGLCVEIALVG